MGMTRNTMLCGLLAMCAGGGNDAAAQSAPAAVAEDEPARVVVSARKRDEWLDEVPLAVTAFGRQAIDDYDIRSFTDYALLTPNLSYAYGNGGTAGNPGTAFADARTIAIRGVAGARTTGFYLDDIPLPGALDVRVVDMRAIEVLKGPQGTLFGEGSLGGNVRVASNAPDLARNRWKLQAEGGRLQGQGGAIRGAEAVGNLVLRPGAAALRLVLHDDSAPGFLTRTYRSNIADPASPLASAGDQGALRNRAASASLLLRPDQRFDLSLRFLWQDQFHHGFPATYAPLPAFRPLAVIDHLANVQPEAADTWSLPVLALRWHGDGWDLVSSVSAFRRHASDTEDSTEGTAQYWGSTIPQPYAWTARHENRQLTHETRLNLDPGGAWKATVGLFWARHEARFGIDPIYGELGAAPGNPSLLWRQLDVNRQYDAALFGEMDWRIAPRLTLTAGLRKYRLRQEDDLGFDYLDVQFRSKNANRASGLSPRAALSWKRAEGEFWYASAAKGFRQGNAQFDPSGFGCDVSLTAIGQTPATMTRIEPDGVWSYEAGVKSTFADGRLSQSAALFRIDWKRIQQPVFLASCGFYMQGNAGSARIEGAEWELAGRPAPQLHLRAALGYTRALITEEGNTGQHVGDPVYQVPRLTASLAAVWTMPLDGGRNLFVAGDAGYTGSSVSANSGAELQLVRAAYRLANLRTGLRRRDDELSLEVRNLTDARPNLGDIGYIGYQRFEPGTGLPVPQVATLPPRAVVVRYVHRW